MNELDDVLSVKKFEDNLTRFCEEKPLTIDWVKAVKVLNMWDLSTKVRFKLVAQQSLKRIIWS